MNRLPQIDVLRTVAVVLVLGRHLRPCPESIPQWLRDTVGIWYRGGWTGVDLFFVLSGFLVSGLLFQELARDGKVQVGRFLIRRAFKIYPPFWLLLCYGLGLSLLRHHGIAWKALGVELTFLQNYYPGLWEHTWSLAVEEHFYLILAGAFLTATSLSRTALHRFLPWCLLCLGGFCLCFRLLAQEDTFDTYRHHFPTHLRLDSLGFGVFGAWLLHCRRETTLALAARHRPALLLFGMLGFLPAFCWEITQTPVLRTVGFTGLYLAAGLLLAGTFAIREPLGRSGKLLAYLGSRSYSIYLWHMPVERASNALVSNIHDPTLAWSAYAMLYLLGTFGAGLVMAKAVEIPSLRLRERFFPTGANPRPSVVVRGEQVRPPTSSAANR